MTRVGVQYAGGSLTIKGFAQRAERAGFASVWCGDHLTTQVDGVAALGVLAGCTEAIGIGTSVLVTPLRPAVVTAKALATAASAAPGRTIAGLGVGGDLPAEFRAAGADLRTRGAFLDEAIDVMQLLWRGRHASFHGRWTTFEHFMLEPAPDVPPQIWIGGRSRAAVRRAARVGAGYLPYLVSPREVETRGRELAALSAEAGRSWHGTIAAVAFVMPAADATAALEAIMDYSIVTAATAVQVRDRWLLGTEDRITARARAYAASGVDHLILGCPPGDQRVVDGFFAAAAFVADELASHPTAGAR